MQSATSYMEIESKKEIEQESHFFKLKIWQIQNSLGNIKGF
jgi:hypothetical protein